MDRETDTVLERIIENCQRISKEFKLEKVSYYSDQEAEAIFIHIVILIFCLFPMIFQIFSRGKRLGRYIVSNVS